MNTLIPDRPPRSNQTASTTAAPAADAAGDEEGPTSAATEMGPDASPSAPSHDFGEPADIDPTVQPTGDDLRAEALALADLGVAVFPLRPRAKRPLLTRGHHLATTDPDTINRWWDETPDANIGIRNGDTFDVIDIDGDDGAESMRTLFGDAVPDRIAEAATPHGRHLYIPAQKDLHRQTRVLPGIDYLGEGGYTVAPPSVLEGDDAYRWVTPPSSPSPDFDLESCRPLLDKVEPTPHSAATHGGGGDRVTHAVPGNRNEALYSDAREAYIKVLCGLADESAVNRQLMAAAQATGLDEPEITKTLTSARREIEMKFAEQIGHHMVDQYARQEAKRALAVASLGGARPVSIRALNAIETSEEDEQWRVRQLLPTGSFTLVFAQPKVGKTTFALNLAACILSGAPFLGRYPVQQVTGKVAYLNLEMITDQLALWADRIGVDKARFLICGERGMSPFLDDAQQSRQFAARLRDEGVEVLIVDSFARIFTGDSENYAAPVARTFNALSAFARDAGISEVIVIAHMGRTGSHPRGTNELEAIPDVLLSLAAVDGVRVMSASGRSVSVEGQALEFDPDTGQLTAAGPAPSGAQRKNHNLRAAFLDALKANPGMNQTDLVNAVKDKGHQFRNGLEKQVLDELTADGTIRREKKGTSLKYYPTTHSGTEAA